MAITDSWLKANHKKERAKAFIKTDRDGLSARVSPKGKITYTLRYYYNDKQRRIDLGTYPLLSIKEARTECERLRKKVEQGHDPKIVRLTERQAIVEAQSLEAMFNQWYDNYCIKNKKNHKEIKRSFEIHVFPKLGKLPVENISIHHWMDILENLAEKRQGIADRILTNTKQLLKFGVRRQLIPSNVLSDINAKEDLQIKKVAGSRSLSDHEVKMVWLAIENSRMSVKNKLFVKLCLIYGCRNGEMRKSEKAHFDFDANVWTIPPENHKMGKASGKSLLRPITPMIKGYLKEAFALSEGSDFVFTNTGSLEPLGLSAPLALPYNIMQYLRRHEGYEMEHWSLHDLRKTMRTNLSSLTQPHIAEIMLGHSLGGVWRTYDHHDYLREQAQALDAWCSRLFKIVGVTPEPVNDNLVQLDSWRRAHGGIVSGVS